MSRVVILSVLAIGLGGSLAEGFVGDEKAGVGAAEAHRIVAQFDRGDPGWKVRMAALVELARQGPATVPVLVEALKKGSPTAREFAAQALVIFADPRAKDALEQALDHESAGLRIHAIQALSMLGRLEPTERHQRILLEDPSRFGARTMMAAALARVDRPDAAALRQALTEYDLRRLDSARVGHVAPDFTLSDFSGKPHRLGDFRGKKTVVVRFILFDF
jgi:hypothetical protein